MEPIRFAKPPQRILIIKPSAIGDIVHALPVLALLRRRWPAAHVTWLVTPGCAGLVERHPLIDEVIRFERHRLAAVWRSAAVAIELHHFIRDLGAKKFDLVVDLQGLFRSGWMALATRARYRVGLALAREGAPLFYTHRVPTVLDEHAVERYLNIASALGCASGPIEFPFAVDEHDRDFIDSLVPRNNRFAVLLPGTNWPTKRWPIERFAAMVRPLREQFGLETVVAGGPGDAALASQIPADRDLVGKTTLRQTIALLERAALVVANDSGPMHIAAALGRPLVVPFGPTNPLRTGPFGRLDSVVRLDIACSPCYSRTCSHQSCLQWLEIEPVLALVHDQLRNGQRGNGRSFPLPVNSALTPFLPPSNRG